MKALFFFGARFLLPTALLLALAACDSGTVPIDLTFSASNQAHTTGAARSAALTLPSVDAGGNTVTLTDFQLSIRDIKFKREGVDPVTGLEAADVELSGPFFLDLLTGDILLDEVIGNASVEPGVYDGIRFVLHKDVDFPPQADASVYLAGTVNGTDFTMWHDTGENFDLSGTNGFTVEEGVPSSLIVDFKLDSILDGINFTGADFAQAISPDAPDTYNNDLADLLKDNIKAAADFGEDSDDDGVLEESEDVD